MTKNWYIRVERTPAGGVGYAHRTKDMCATVYTKYIRVFYCRDLDISHNNKFPAAYTKEKRISRRVQ